ncbi:DeoR/GlpR family DNA-binding transcription regulator [Oricola sp.]|uniref:DeoR/GlpR family DNA-binding transcription regulator n=1 Tax=Oricola sp. TaxID=1979950 RepID=UPI0025DE8FAE|nr:DeoR/GlpR family DNA-binding transcription regulator [Oricola sp.]MCI5077886.1 DeoR/GlpR family DNA-binding transcription regulator [Oricola sp.]
MLALPPRQMDILDLARRKGRVDVETLAAHFSVTPQTIRKDLNDLCDMERLHRVHGGAVFPSSTVNLAWQERRDIASGAKQRIADRAASLIPDGSSVILNIGTTVEQVAHGLRRHHDLMVITNNLNVATILSDAPGVELVISGGMVRKADGGIVGEAAIDLIRQFKVDCAVIGASAIDADGALLDFDYREVRVARAILEQARVKMLVADTTKFERRAPVQIGHLGDIDTFITDAAPPDEIAEICARAGVDLIVTDTENDIG